MESTFEPRKDIGWFTGPWRRSAADDPGGGYLHRDLQRRHEKAREHTNLHEALVRFPSAPVFGFQRKRDYQVRLKPIHQHTFRLLTTQPPGESPIERLFLFFNGMNEIDHLGFYYNLAELLIDGRADIACLIYPYPGHLGRYPMIGTYAEKPLQRYINDPAELFRQYLRFMTEMQWLLSVLVPVSCYPVVPGADLLAENEDPKQGRSDDDCLGEEIVKAWRAMSEASARAVRESDERAGYKELRETGLPVTFVQVRQSIAAIRRLIGWRAYGKPLTEHECAPESRLPPPRLHVVGYSLGAYLAQSVFFSWPFAIGSCTTVCAGAALQDLRPVRLANEEEWRAITRGLKYEIESSMLQGRLKWDADTPASGGGSVCGIPASYFSAHFQIFNDVFLQDPHGSYRSRVSEFTPRLLFVVGGNDPIVSTRLVQEASPPEGINMIEVANLSHFVAIEGGEWRRFWLPMVAGVISKLSQHSETLQACSVLSNLWNDDTTGLASYSDLWPRRENGDEPTRARSVRIDPEPLDSEGMRKSLVELVDPLQRGGFLFILRNQLPFTLMGKLLLHRRGGVPHYEDFQIRTFWQHLQDRQATMTAQADRIVLVLPGRLNEWFKRKVSVLSPKPHSLARRLPKPYSLQEIWEAFLNDWEPKGALYRFDPERPRELPEGCFALERMVRIDTTTPAGHPVLNCLPDLWIGLSAKVVAGLTGLEGKPKAEELRAAVTDEFLDHIHRLYRERRGVKVGKAAVANTRNWLTSGDLRLIRISAAESNPRFLGERIWDLAAAADALVHSALAITRSKRCERAGDFEDGWVDP